MIIDKPWGQEELLFVGPHYVVKRLTMEAGHCCSLQYHRYKHETVYVVEGCLYVLIGQSEDSLDEIVLSANEHLVIAPNTVHQMAARNRCVYLEASTSELDDVVRLNDPYGRP